MDSVGNRRKWKMLEIATLELTQEQKRCTEDIQEIYGKEKK